MGRRILLHPRYRGRLPGDWASWSAARGTLVARSRTTETHRIVLGGLPLHLKRYRYSPGRALKNAPRNTWIRPSRPSREYRMLLALREDVGPDAAPAPVMTGERRFLGFLREAMLATETIPGSRPLDAELRLDREAARALGRFLARIYGAGFIHGGLYARNLLLGSDGSFRVVDLDRARRLRRPEPGAAGRLEALFARDLARLDVSATTPSRTWRLRVLLSFLAGSGWEGKLRDWVRRIARERLGARRRIERRRGG